jgi:hypothetical protein
VASAAEYFSLVAVGAYGVAAAGLCTALLFAYIGNKKASNSDAVDYVEQVINEKRHKLFFDLPSNEHNVYRKCCDELFVS